MNELTVRYSESPEVAAATNELLLRFGNEVWLIGSKQVHDDAGARLQINVDELLYVDDVLPRVIETEHGRVFLVVQRVASPVVDEVPLWPIGKA